MKKEKISQNISKELLKRIEEGIYPPGSKLPTEMELTVEFGVSRVSIREALSMLKASGIITSKQGGGSYVDETGFSSLIPRIHLHSDEADMIHHLFEMRKILEPEAAYLAAQRRTPEQLALMKEIIGTMETEVIENQNTATDADLAFHKLLFAASHNPVLIQTLESLSSLYERTLQITLRPNRQLEKKRRSVLNEHKSILEAIESEEPELARVQCHIHLKNAENKISLFLKEENELLKTK